MPNNFLATAESIANDFLQSVVFIDDKAYTSETSNEHYFNALEISNQFAKSQKICAVYKPRLASDIATLAELAKKSDVTVIDWQILIEEEPVEGEEIDTEEDAEEDAPRGPHTRKIIKEILADPITGKGSIKLIIIYTGEVDLYGIINTVHNDLKEEGIDNLVLDESNCLITTPNIRIRVLAKPSPNPEVPKFPHNPELHELVVPYAALPQKILGEFTSMTSGLLSNFILHSLSILRNNTFRLLKLFNKSLDAPFLTHRLLLPVQEDAEDHMIEYLLHCMRGSLLYNDAGQALNKASIVSWLDYYKISPRKITISNKEVELTHNDISSLYTNEISEVLTNHWDSKKLGNIPSKLTQKFKDQIKRLGAKFIQEIEGEDTRDLDFSILTHQKSNLKQPSKSPMLTLGVIIKDTDKNSFYLCLQAKCDSVRIKEERRFIFLELEEAVSDKFSIVVEKTSGEYLKLVRGKSTYNIRTIKFKPENEANIIEAELVDDQFIFTSIHNEKFEWICDLTDARAQSIAHSIASQLSRIGLDEYEWFRLKN